MSRAATLGLLLALLLAPAAVAADRDRDGLPDRWERKHRARAAAADLDRDGLSNLGEYRARTNPRRRDSDRDRRPDGREDADRDRLDNRTEMTFGWHPRKADSDRDGIRDGAENSGTVTGVSGQAITLALARGGRITATIEDTDVVACSVLQLPGAAAGPGEASIGADDDPEADFWDPDWGPRPTDPDAEDADLDADLDAAVAGAAQVADPFADPADDEPEEPFVEAVEETVDAGLECLATLRRGTLVRQAVISAGRITRIDVLG